MNRDHHEQFGIPSNARYTRHAYPLPDRTEPRIVAVPKSTRLNRLLAALGLIR